MSFSPSSPQEETKPHSPFTAPREIPDSDPSSSVSSPAEASDPAPSGLSGEEVSKSNPTMSYASSSFQVDPIQASIKPAPQEPQDTELLLPPPISSPQDHPDTDSNLVPPSSSPPPPPPINPQEAKKIVCSPSLHTMHKSPHSNTTPRPPCKQKSQSSKPKSEKQNRSKKT